MNNKSIKYIAFYSNDKKNSQNRQISLSATNKIDYICNALIKNGYNVEIVSPSWTNNKGGFYRGENIKIAEKGTLKYFATFGAKSKLQRSVKYLFSLFQLFLYLLINTEKGELIIVYHSVILSLPIRLVKFIKKLKIVLEVEEIYQDVQPLSKFMKKSEFSFFNSADRFIFSTGLLNEKVNPIGKPYTVIYGTYKAEDNRNCQFNDDKIHVVYAGTFDPRKGGAATAVSVATYLPKNYHVHVIGFGSKKEIKNIQDIINEVSKKTEATITYDGLLSGEEYIQFLQKCDIGLSTQIPDATYNETSFPSKILSYLANGLRVVSVRIKAIELSDVGKAVYYYKEQTPEAIAKAILSINVEEPYDSRALINSLNEKFIVNIQSLLENEYAKEND